jgi:hypothetical protein
MVVLSVCECVFLVGGGGDTRNTERCRMKGRRSRGVLFDGQFCAGCHCCIEIISWNECAVDVHEIHLLERVSESGYGPYVMFSVELVFGLVPFLSSCGFGLAVWWWW